jgi:dipeptidyl aminopeptidase/acylaminoacyl peptidase
MILSLILATTPLAVEPLIPFHILARGPSVSAVAISPDGSRVATIEMNDGRASIYEGEAGGPRRLIYRNPERSIDNIRWSADGRWLYFLQDSGGDEGYHLFRLDRENSGRVTDLTPYRGAAVELVSTPRGYAGPVLVTINRRDPQYADVYSVNLTSGQVTEVFRNDGQYTEFYADAQGRIRATGRIVSNGSLELWGRNDEHGSFARLYVAPATERFKALAFHADGQSIVAKTNRQGNFERAVLITIAGGRTRPLRNGSCGQYDIDDILQDQSGPIGTVCTRVVSEIEPFQTSFARDVRAARTLVGAGSLSLESRSENGQITIFYSDASNRPGRFVIVRNGVASTFAETRPELASYRFAPSEPFRMRARDGMPLLGYITRPLGQNVPGPTIVAVHGGPWTRDVGGFERETQFYANRGYTVVQVNFRGSTGLGKRLFEGGMGEFGGRMSDDVDDAVRFAVRSGWADPNRVCIMGGSYGGFAALTGISRPNGFNYRCAVAYAGPADLETLVRAFPPSWQPFLPRSWYRFVGRPDRAEDVALMRSRSPLTHAANMQAPLLIFQGANDPRVRQDQSDRIVCSLRARAIDVDYLLASNEGHSFANEETSLAITRATEQFFGRHLGGRVGDQTTPAATDALNAFRTAGRQISC